MKLITKEFEKDGSGYYVLRPDEQEDLWHAYNLISKGDVVRATTIRKVAKPLTSGATESERIKLNLSVLVEGIDFDPAGSVLRLNGRNQTENEWVKLGAYHTLDIELHRNLTLYKSEWDSIALDRIRQATDPRSTADVAAVVMNEGLAHVCLISGSMTLLRQRLEMSIPRKRGAAAAGHEKALHKFFEVIMSAVQKHVDFSIVKCVIVASPGFVKDQFLEYMFAEALRRNIKDITENRSKFLPCHSSSGHKHALKEVLADAAVAPRLADTKAAEEVRALNTFHEMLSDNPDRAYYGYDHVSKANDRAAIQTLLLTDALFRNQSIEMRRRYVELVESVRAGGGQVFIFSTLHVSGEQLAQLTGVAAILRFPLPEIEEEDEEADEDEEAEEEAADDGDGSDRDASPL